MAKKKIAEYGDEKVAVKVYYDSEYGEYVARLYLHGKLHEPSDAFDTDRQSIIDTALSMLKHELKKNPRDIHIDIGAHNVKRNPIARKMPRTDVGLMHKDRATLYDAKYVVQCSNTENGVKSTVAAFLTKSEAVKYAKLKGRNSNKFWFVKYTGN